VPLYEMRGIRVPRIPGRRAQASPTTRHSTCEDAGARIAGVIAARTVLPASRGRGRFFASGRRRRCGGLRASCIIASHRTPPSSRAAFKSLQIGQDRSSDDR
jgi:hypothetical protein